MRVPIAVACGEVVWERELLALAGRGGVLEVAKRYVDVAGIERDLQAGALPRAIVMSPALRGFVEKPVTALATATHLVVLMDSIRPPWLAGSGLDCRDVDGLDLDGLLDELATWADGPVAVPPRDDPELGVVTAFMGISGGVGTSSLAHLYAQATPHALLLDADARRPSLGFLLGRAAAVPGLFEAIHGDVAAADLTRLAGAERVLSLAPGEADGIATADLLRLLDEAVRCFPEVIVDTGSDSPWLEALLARCDRVVVVAAATPLGVVRLCSDVNRLPRPLGGMAVVANRARDSAIGSSRWMSVVRNLIEAEIGVDPQFVSDRVEAFDQAWLDGNWQVLEGALPHLKFSHL